ncbi:hypothetical protein [Streptomyces sp. NPDC005143]
MAVRKDKIIKAIGALRKAGMSPELAKQCVKLLDLDEAIGPQIAALAEEDPEMFEADVEEEADAAERERPMTAREAQLSRLQVDRKPRPRPVATQSASAQRLAKILRSNGADSENGD